MLHNLVCLGCEQEPRHCHQIIRNDPCIPQLPDLIGPASTYANYRGRIYVRSRAMSDINRVLAMRRSPYTVIEEHRLVIANNT